MLKIKESISLQSLKKYGLDSNDYYTEFRDDSNYRGDAIVIDNDTRLIITIHASRYDSKVYNILYKMFDNKIIELN